MKPDRPTDADDVRRLISALADGEADADECGRAVDAWAEGGSLAQRSWHAYHLIGDALRSEDLCSAPGHDQAFLERLRSRLAAEPAVPAFAVASAPLSAGGPSTRGRRWLVPMALAAGLMALASALVLELGAGAPASSAPVLAAVPAAAPALAAAGSEPAVAVLETSAQGDRIVRDARLDRYLRAHRDYGAALPGALPGGSGRSIVTASLER
jgi:sigma-E factor negative regulatory protein RseA